MSTFIIQRKGQVDDGIGGFVEKWVEFKKVEAYIDLVTGTDLNTVQNSFVEQSTHLLIIPTFTEGITDKMRVVDKAGRVYGITYADDPVGVGHHNELYLKFEDDANG